MQKVMSNQVSEDNLENLPEIPFKIFSMVLFALTVGVLFAVVVLPTWLPGLTRSMVGQDVKVYWYISRGSAIVSYCLLWFSMAFGLIMANKMARLWPGAPTAYELHQFISLLGLATVIVHALVLLGDRYMSFNLAQLIIPFFSSDYKPLLMGLGQIGFYLWVVLIISFYLRRKISTRTWRLIHFASFMTFLFALVHGISIGTDITTSWMKSIYWISAGSILFLIVYRILNAFVGMVMKFNQNNT